VPSLPAVTALRQLYADEGHETIGFMTRLPNCTRERWWTQAVVTKAALCAFAVA
jgi:hypothetical protein